jgi:hypothetical protein
LALLRKLAISPGIAYQLRGRLCLLGVVLGNRRIQIVFDRAIVASQQCEQLLLCLGAIKRLDRSGNRLCIGDDLLLSHVLGGRVAGEFRGHHITDPKYVPDPEIAQYRLGGIDLGLVCNDHGLKDGRVAVCFGARRLGRGNRLCQHSS